MLGTVPGMLNVIANIAPNECATETAAILEPGAFKDTFSEEEELHAKLAEIDNLRWETAQSRRCLAKRPRTCFP